MLKSDLVNILVAKKGVTQKQAEATVEMIFGAMKDALVAGENIEIRGLGRGWAGLGVTARPS